MRVGRPRRLMRLASCLSALAMFVGTSVWSAPPAAAQTAVLALRKSVSLNPPTVPPNERFTYFLSASCSSLSEPCTGVQIVDVLPPELATSAADVELGGQAAAFNYNAATRTATFTMFDPMLPGTIAQVSISVRFPAGTPPGVSATNSGRMTATNAAAVTSNPVTVTVRATSSWRVSKGLASGQIARVGEPLTYRVGLTVAAGGTQPINNARMVDTLPPGVTFVSATGGGTYNPATNTVTWNLGTVTPQANSDVTVSREVTVIFPSPPYQVGDRPNNVVEAFGAPSGDPDQSLGRASYAVTLRGPGDITTAGKRATLLTLGPGQSDTYTVSGANPNPGPLDAFTILDTLPLALVAVQDGQPNVTGTGTPPQVSYGPNAGSQTPVTVSNLGGGRWGATVPASAAVIAASFGTVPVGFSVSFQIRAGIQASGLDRAGNPIPADSPIRNCATVTASSGGTPATPRTSCTDQTVMPLAVLFSKVITSQPVTTPGGTLSWQIGVGVDAASAGELVNPVVTDCLPPGLDLVNPVTPADPRNGSTPANFPPPTSFTRTVNACGTNQVLLTWTWASFSVPRGVSGTIVLNTTVALDAAPGSVTNTATLVGSNLTTALTRTAPLAITSSTLLYGAKQVKGTLDPTFVGLDTIGRTQRGGISTYRAVITNTSDVPVTDLMVIDTEPIPGDVGALVPVPRGSAWQPVFAGNVQSAAPATILYSTSFNPCRPEFTGTNTPGCQPANWTAAPAGGTASVGSILFDFGNYIIPPGGALTFSWDVLTPANAPIGQVAWNSFAYTANRADNNAALVPSEPRKVGLQVVGNPEPPPPGISLVKYVNGIHAPNPPGPNIPAGNDVVFTYLVTNTGTLTLVNIVLVDDQLGTITCPRTTLAPGESMTCTSPTRPAISGQYHNVATVTGYPVDRDGNPAGPPLTDTDTGNYYNGELPDTGAGSGTLIQVGALLLATGFGFLLLGRLGQRGRRRRGAA